MNIAQMRYYIEVARCQSISVAAERLFITQPTLGRQMTSLESELNMQLFLRSNRGIRLTPAGIVLYQEWERLLADYQSSLEKAERAGRGYREILRIGLISGLNLSGVLKNLITFFDVHHPNIKITLNQYSFRALLHKLYHDELDAVISYHFHLKERERINTALLEKNAPMWLVPESNPLSRRDKLSFPDMKKEHLLIVEREDCPEGVQLIVDVCKHNGDFYPNFYFVENMENVMLWLRTTDKCALLNERAEVPEGVKAIPLSGGTDDAECDIELAWKAGNDKFSLNVLRDFLL